MVCPHNKSQGADPEYGVDHPEGAEGFGLSRGVGDNVRNSPKAGENEDVDFWVAKKSEEMLVEDGVPAACGVKEGGV